MSFFITDPKASLKIIMTPSCRDPAEVIIPLLDFSTSLTFNNLNYTVQQGSTSKTLLSNVSGSFRSGRLVAILGPSGAGKSTLLNVLSGYKAKGVKGQILINNEVVERQRYRQLVAYNAQEVKLLPNITVEETLRYTADLKMSSKVPDSEKKRTINGIVKLLGLENCTKTQARLLSGGEKKRLSIGQELVSNPRILFFDEPTSGLDSESSYQVISYMKDLAKQGRCVISVIHQPSSELLELFDDVYLVAGGHCLYRGSLDNLIPTLSEVGFVCPQYYNRADFAIKIASKSNPETEKVNRLIRRMELTTNSDHNGNKHPDRLSLKPLDEDESRSQYPISQWRQFTILTRRTTLGTVRNFTLTVLRFIGHLVFGIIIGTVYYDIGNDGAKILSNIGFIMLTLLFIVFANAMSVVLTFPLEMAVFIREYKSNSYSIVAYFCSKIVADFPLMLAGITLFHGTAYYLTGQITEPDRVAWFWALCVGMGWFAQVYGLLGGCIFPIEVSPFIIPVTLLPAVLFCGFFIRYDELFAAFQPLTFVSPFRFTFEGASLALYGFGRKDLGCSEMFCYYRKPVKILDMLDMKNGNFWIDIWGLVTIIVLLHVALYICLRMRLR